MKKIFLLLLLLSSFSLIYAQTIEELRDSMAAGNLNMQVDLAIRYIYGDGVNQDSQEALRLIQDAADKGNRYGELWLGICHEQGIGRLDISPYKCTLDGTTYRGEPTQKGIYIYKGRKIRK